MKPTLDSRCRSFYSFLHRLNDGWFGATPKRKLRGTLAKDQGFLILLYAIEGIVKFRLCEERAHSIRPPGMNVLSTFHQSKSYFKHKNLA